MATVGVRELKANLSAYLKRVGAGAHLTVTDRGRAVATLAPADGPKNAGWAWRMVAEGAARWGGGKPVGLQRRIQRKGAAVSRMVIEDRR